MMLQMLQYKAESISLHKMLCFKQHPVQHHSNVNIIQNWLHKQTGKNNIQQMAQQLVSLTKILKIHHIILIFLADFLHTDTCTSIHLNNHSGHPGPASAVLRWSTRFQVTDLRECQRISFLFYLCTGIHYLYIWGQPK